jgi:hypothetical protein
MANTTIGSITLHDGASAIIVENNCRKESSVTVLPLYLSDSDQTDVFDFGGTVKLITLTGVYLGVNTAALKTWIDSVEVLIQGHQDTDAGYPLTFTDDLRGTIKVKIMDFDSTFAEGNQTRIDWSIKLVQSSTNA